MKWWFLAAIISGFIIAVYGLYGGTTWENDFPALIAVIFIILGLILFFGGWASLAILTFAALP